MVILQFPVPNAISYFVMANDLPVGIVKPNFLENARYVTLDT